MENKKSPATQVLRKLVFSRCKSKMPKEMSSLRPDLHLIYKQKKIDSVLNSRALMTFNHIYEKLFKNQQTGFFSNHVVLISGRRWNSAKQRCEYRIIGSQGSQCEGVITNENILPSKKRNVGQRKLSTLHSLKF